MSAIESTSHPPHTPTSALDAAIRIAGTQQRLAERINGYLPADERIGGSAVSNWRQRGQVASEMVLHTCRAVDFAVTPHQLRPDLYPHPEDGLPEDRRVLASLEGASDLLKPQEAAALGAAIAHGGEATANTLAALEPDLDTRLALLRDAESRS